MHNPRAPIAQGRVARAGAGCHAAIRVIDPAAAAPPADAKADFPEIRCRQATDFVRCLAIFWAEGTRGTKTGELIPCGAWDMALVAGLCLRLQGR